jgi:arginase
MDERHRPSDLQPETAETVAGERSSLVLIGAPFDLGSGYRGSAGGPAVLRASLAVALRQGGWEVSDSGELPGLTNLPAATVDGCRNLDAVIAACRTVREATSAALTGGQFPLLLGGDHSLAIGSIAAVSQHCARQGRPLFVLWFDAHADFNTPQSSPSGCVYGMPVAVISGEGHSSLLALGHSRPIVDISRIALIGVRSVDPLEVPRVAGRGLRVFSMAEIRRHGMATLTGRALADAVRLGAHVHVSFDLDVLDPEEAPGVGLPEADGTDFVETTAALRAALQTGLVGSFDLMEHSPTADPSGQTTQRVIEMMTAVFRKGG